MSLFDDVVPRYEAFCNTPLGQFINKVEREIILTLSSPQPDELWIDLGCGTGEYSIALASFGCHVIGLDESESMLERARMKSVISGTVKYDSGDISCIPYSDGLFDGALIQVTLEFVKDAPQVLKETLRVLRPSGRLVIGLIQRLGSWAQYYQIRAKTDPSTVYRHAHFWTVRELYELLHCFPVRIEGGLYVSPNEFTNLDTAWEIESQRRKTWPLDKAGFIGLRFDRKDCGSL
ncbi:class I SAM-dependent methyltransferase [Sulfobacillus thermosulfidooxidans]|uniref:class I SAM-dependent methyltransferase n=1 Tax=Sulfobacillus thermosulfidooxidans TaxID=28034 RepID=UPI0006B5170B|nr:class I SAM-dependent methyltransferase [Sulfobacillus thermosulfidooxidans]